MLNWKRFFVGWALFFTATSLLIGSSVYFFDVNDYSNWISEKIESSTGYDLRFERLDNNWIMDNSVSLMGVSLYQQQQHVASIQQIEINIDKLDLWLRQLDINSITLKGVEIEVDMASLMTKGTTGQKSVVTSKDKELDWNRLFVKKINIIDLDTLLENKQQRIQIQAMNFDLNDLFIINNNKLQVFPPSINLATQIQSLQLQDNQQEIRFTELKLLLKGELLQRQAQLNVETGSVEIAAEQQPGITLENVKIDLQLAQDNLRLNNLTVDAFSGDLALQGNASLGLTLLPKPDIKVKEVIIEALVIKNMQLIIPQWQASVAHNETSLEQQLLPLESLLLKKLQLQNIDIESTNVALPLMLKNLQLNIVELSLIKNNQWLKLIEKSKQAATFHIYSDYFSWEDTIFEQFSVSGSLTKDDQSLLFLQQQLLEKE